MKLTKSLKKEYLSNPARLVAQGIHARGYSTYITSADIGMPIASPAEFVNFAETVDAASVTHELARLNVMLQVEDHGHELLQRQTAQDFLSPPTLAKVEAILANQSSNPVWISSFQLRCLLDLILTHGAKRGGRSLEDPSVRHQLGALFLSAGNTFAPQTGYYPQESPLWWVERHIDISKAGFVTDTRGIEDISIKGYVLKRLLAELGIDQAFEDLLGFSPVQYQTAVIGIWAHAAHLGYEHARQVGPVTLGFEYMMGQLGVNRRVGEQILSEFVVDIDAEPSGNICVWRPNFGSLADRPLIKHGQSYLCIDLAYMQSRVARSLWNLALKVAKRIGKKSRFEGDAGLLFEDYCADFLRICEKERKSKGMWLAPKKDLESKVRGNANVDGFMSDESYAAVFEYKSAPLPTAPLFGSDPKELADAIDHKLIHGKKGEKLGFSQIANRLEGILAEPEKFHLTHCTKIVPCLISAEPAVAFAPLYTYIQKEAAKLFEKFGDRVARPIILHPEDLRLLAMRSKRSMTYMLKVLSEHEVVQYGTIQNVILSLWPHDVMRRMYNDVEVARPLDFFDQGIEYLDTNSVRAPTRECPKCGSERRFVTDFSGSTYWWCGLCKSRSIASAEDAEEQRVHREMIIEQYRLS